MESSPQTLRILPLTNNELMLESIESAIDQHENYTILQPPQTEENIMDGIYNLQPDYILLDYNYDEADPLSLIDSITIQFPEMIVIAILPSERINESNNVILAGARAFMIQPFTQMDLLNTLNRVKELVARNAIIHAEQQPQQPLVRSRGTFVVFSPRGGAGCSSIAINIALLLLEKMKEEVLLMDGKLLFGHLDLLLNLRTQNSIAELISHIGALDDSLIRDVITTHVSGLQVLPSPPLITSAQGIRPEDLYNLLIDLQTVFPNIIIDGGNYLNENAVTYMDASNKVLLVITPEIAALRDASQFFDVCRTLAYPKDKILVLVNQYDKRDGLSLDEIEKSLQVKVFGTIPWDRRGALNSINRGVPITLQRSNSTLRKAYQDIAGDLIKYLEKKPVEGGGPRRAGSDVLSKSSRLG